MDIAVWDLILAYPDRRALHGRIDRERKGRPQHAAKPIPVRACVDE
jgi:hypothetical protein